MTEPNTPEPAQPAGSRSNAPQPSMIPQAQSTSAGRKWVSGVLLVALLFSAMLNLVLFVLLIGTSAGIAQQAAGPNERFHSGEIEADEKIALISVTGTIMPPLTKQILRAIKQAKEDESVSGVVLVIDSPGGLVADSHQIYHRLKELEKPIFVAMKRMAASGGYYIAMGAGEQGQVFAEPTTWTGSIGVIIPRFNLSQLADKYGVKSEPLKTGPFKDALSPFRELSQDERVVWDEILDESYSRFLNVIAENRSDLDFKAARDLATGQIYTATQAKTNGMIDEIGYEDDTIDALKKHLGLEKARVVSYEFRPSLLQMLTGSVQAKEPQMSWRTLLEATVPQALYLCSWAPSVPSS